MWLVCIFEYSWKMLGTHIFPSFSCNWKNVTFIGCIYCRCSRLLTSVKLLESALRRCYWSTCIVTQSLEFLSLQRSSTLPVELATAKEALQIIQFLHRWSHQSSCACPLFIFTRQERTGLGPFLEPVIEPRGDGARLPIGMPQYLLTTDTDSYSYQRA